MQDETTYMLEPTAFHSMREAQVLTDQLEQNLSHLSNVAANIKPQVVEMFSEMVNNAAEHGMSDTGAHCHVRLIPNPPKKERVAAGCRGKKVFLHIWDNGFCNGRPARYRAIQ